MQNQEELLSAVQQISELEASLAGGHKPKPIKTVRQLSLGCV